MPIERVVKNGSKIFSISSLGMPGAGVGERRRRRTSGGCGSGASPVGDGERAALGHRLDGVQAEVEEHLLHEVGVEPHLRAGPRRSRARARRRASASCSSMQVERLLDARRAGRTAAGRAARRPGEQQQPGDDLLDPVELLDDVVQVLAPRVAGLELGATRTGPWCGCRSAGCGSRGRRRPRARRARPAGRSSSGTRRPRSRRRRRPARPSRAPRRSRRASGRPRP